MKTPLFFIDKPLFGLDIGHSTIKVIQLNRTRQNKITVNGYGAIDFDPNAVVKGELVNIEELARQTHKLFSSGLTGKIETRRVAASLPVSFTYSRVVNLPPMEDKDLKEAVRLEVEQSIPVPYEELYVDYESADNPKDNTLEVLIVAAPKKIVDSYEVLFNALGLELVLLETTINSVARIVSHADSTDTPTLIIDFGSISSDLAVYDRTIRVTGTVDWGGETLTKEIAKALDVSQRQAQTIKTRYGLDASKKQKEITKALQPVLTRLINEIKRITRFYTERAGKEKAITQIVIVGGGANLPSLSAYLTDNLRLPTRLVNPWNDIDFGRLQPPHKLEHSLYSTAAGLSLIDGSNYD